MHKRLRTVQIVQKRTETLRALLRRNASEYQLLKAAVKLRDARIHALKALTGEVPLVIITPEQTRRVAKIQREIESLQATPPSAFIAEIQNTLNSDS